MKRERERERERKGAAVSSRAMHYVNRIIIAIKTKLLLQAVFCLMLVCP